MPLTLPQLDDRSYQELLDAALTRIRQDLNTDWNDLSAGDPGVVLLEAFAFLTEQMLYRLNRLPEKAYIAFLHLLGVSLYPPAAARARLSFWHAQEIPAGESLTLPRGTRIAPSGGSDDKLAHAFTLAQDVEIPAASRDKNTAVQTLAYHCERVEEDLGVSSGMPGQTFSVQRPPLVAPLGNWLDLVVGVEVTPAERQTDDPEGSDGRLYRRWQEVERFSHSDENSPVYTVDRTAGAIQFAPAARKAQAEGERLPSKAALQAVVPLGAIPLAGRHIRAWYARGGGEAGNLAAGALGEILDLPAPAGTSTVAGTPGLAVTPGLADIPAPAGTPAPLLLAGLAVTNLKPAWGGMEAEILANALVRGPHEIFSHGNVVTARDYEQLVLRKSRSIARARAYARHMLWKHAKPGTVEIALLPALPSKERQSVTLEALKANERSDDLAPIHRELNEKSPLGTRCELVWARYKKVWVEADLTVSPGADRQLVRQRVINSLNRLLSPLPPVQKPGGEEAANKTAADKAPHAGWPFGQELLLAQVYQQVLASEPDITLVRRLSLMIEEAPDQAVRCLAADSFQPHTWYAASARRLFRSTNNGLGWEKVLAFEAGEAGRLFLPGMENGRPTWRQTEERRPENVSLVCPSPGLPGVVAAATRLENTPGDAGAQAASAEAGSALYATANCGETWYCLVSRFDGEIEDMAWLPRGSRHILLLATSQGLYEVDVAFQPDGEPELAPGGEPPAGPAPDEKIEIMPLLAPVDPNRPTLPLYAVTVVSKRGNARVAVAAKSRQGVYLSRADDLIPALAGGRAASNFDYLGLYGEDVRHLNVQKHQNQTFLWAAAMAVGDAAHGCYRWQFDVRLAPGAVTPVSGAWSGGSCHALAFQGARVLAATAWGGILTAEFDPDNWAAIPTWQNMGADFLPRRIRNLEDEGDPNNGSTGSAAAAARFFRPLVTLASNDEFIAMTGGEDGVYRRAQAETSFEKVSRTELRVLRDAVTLPPNWLFVSGDHQVEVNYGGPRQEKHGAANAG